MFGMYTGVLESTAATNANGKNIRDALADGGGHLIEGAVYGKVNTDGSVAFIDAAGNASATPVENTTYAPGNTYGYDFYKMHELSLFDGSFVKLREVSLGYSFNKIGLLNKIGLSSLDFSLVGRNLWIIYKNIPDLDPEVSSSAGNTSVGAESNAIPSTRSYGFNLRVNF